MSIVRTNRVQGFFVLTILLLALFVPLKPAFGAWMAGRGTDASGMAYLAVINDNITGDRFELNCTPSGQAFLALSWQGDSDTQGADKLALRFNVDGSYQFAAPARYKPMNNGWTAAELKTSDIIAPLTASLAVARSTIVVELVAAGQSILRTAFDMNNAAKTISYYRAYCHL